MIIQHNIPALNAYRQLNGNNMALARNLEKLASGYRINRAGDDAAGLAISEKMRAQIKGLETASKNAMDGISVIQTAEGALTEVHSMLNRMVELATQAANGIYDDAVDRKALDDEFQALKAEINRISQATNFNGKNLLDGTLDSNFDTFVAAVTQIIPAGTKTITTTNGSDLIAALGTILGADTIPNGTIIDPQKSEFTIDLGDIRVEGGAAAFANTDTIDITIGVNKYTLENAGGDDWKDPSVLAAALSTKLQADTAFKDAKGNSHDLTTGFSFGGAGSIITITQDDPPDDEGKVLWTSMEVLVDNLVVADTDYVLTGDYNVGTITNVQGNVAGVTRLASTMIVLEDLLDLVEDGTVFTIGNEKYTFRVGADSAIDSGPNVINLDAFEKADFAANLDAIGTQITADTTGNAVFTVGYDVGTKNLTFLEMLAHYNPTAPVLDDFNAVAAQFKIENTTVSTEDEEVIISPASGIKGLDLALQVGDTADPYNIIKVSVRDMSCVGLEIDSLNIKTYDTAVAAIGTIAQQGDPGTIKGAINMVSAQRAELGALQNRLEHSINNLGVTTENLTAAESRIRDTDMAKEMMAYTKNNILVQAAQAMLAQANMIPQGVLQLLR